MGWQQRPFLCQVKAEGLIFVCFILSGRKCPGRLSGDSCFPGNQERGDAIAKTAQGWTQGDTFQGNVSSCAQGTQTSPRQRCS